MTTLGPQVFSEIGTLLNLLGSTKPHFWPFGEKDGQLVAGFSTSGDLTPAETSGTAEALEDDFSPLLLPGWVYSYHFNPSGDHHLAGSDHADLSFGDGSTDNAFSCGALIIPTVVNDNSILAKYDSAGGVEEYRFFIDSNAKLSLELHDASASAKEVAISDNTLVVHRTYSVVATYDGDQATPVVKLYVNGVLDNGDGDTTETGAYVAMEDTAAPLTIGCAGVTATPTTEFHGRIAMPFITGKELSAAEVMAIHNLYRHVAGIS